MVTSQMPTRYDLEAQLIQSMSPRFFDSVNLSTGCYSPQNLDLMHDKKALAMRRKSECKTEKDHFIDAYCDFFSAAVAWENQSVDYSNGYQWSDAQLKEIRAQNLLPIQSNYFRRWVESLTGEYIGATKQFLYEHRDPSSKDEADLWNQVAGVICRQNNWDLKSGDLFDDAAMRGRSFAQVGLDPRDPRHRMIMKRHRPAEFLYDHDAWENGTGEGGKYLFRCYYRDIEDLIFEFPLWENELRKKKQGHRGHERLQFTLKEPKVRPTSLKEEVHVSKRSSKNGFFTNRAVWVEEFQRKSAEPAYAVRDGIWHIDHVFDNVEQSVYFYKELRAAYEAAANAEGLEYIDMVDAPRRTTQTVLDVEYWAGDLLLDIQTRKQEDFTYIPCHPDFHDGEWRGKWDDDKGEQARMNRHGVYEEMILAGGNGKWAYDADFVPKDMTPEQFEQNLTRPTKALKIKRTQAFRDRPLSDGLHYFDPGNRSHLPAHFREEAMGMIQHNGGGPVQVGEYKTGMSAKLGAQLQVAAQAGNVKLFKRVQNMEETVGATLIEQAQHLSPVALLEMCDPRDRQRLLPVINNGIQSVRDGQFVTQVQEIIGGPSKRQAEIQQINEFIVNAPQMTEDLAPELMELMTMPSSRIERVKVRMAARMKAQAEAAEREQQRLDFSESEKWRLGDLDRQIKLGHLQIAAAPPTKTALVIKPMDPGPKTVATVMESAGMEADPAVIAEDQSLQRLMDQSYTNLRQSEQNRLTPEWQKKQVSPSKAGHQGKRQGGPSAKDTSARKRKVVKKT